MNVAVIPVRGGSKSIPLKNIKHIAGKPLVYWVLSAAVKSRCIDRIYVSTDSEKIAEVVRNFDFSKVEVVGRSAEGATDFASTEAVLLEFAHEREFDNIVLIQATSPMLRADDLDRGFELFNEDGVDSVLSVVKQKRFCWKQDNDGKAIPINYNVEARPRRQEFEGYFVENGAFYITSRERLISSGVRISGAIKMCEMNEDSYYEIDELDKLYPKEWTVES